MSVFADTLQDHLAVVGRMAELEPQLEALASDVQRAFEAGNKLLVFGNGGSAADSQHIAAELTGRFERDRRGLPAIALTTDTSALTAIGNDFGYEKVFSRQVEALARPGDVLLGISTSGNSPNVLRALEVGLATECVGWGFAGRDGGQMQAMLEGRLIIAPSNVTARIQECHILLGHALCDLVERAFAA